MAMPALLFGREAHYLERHHTTLFASQTVDIVFIMILPQQPWTYPLPTHCRLLLHSVLFCGDYLVEYLFKSPNIPSSRLHRLDFETEWFLSNATGDDYAETHSFQRSLVTAVVVHAIYSRMHISARCICVNNLLRSRFFTSLRRTVTAIRCDGARLSVSFRYYARSFFKYAKSCVVLHTL